MFLNALVNIPLIQPDYLRLLNGIQSVYDSAQYFICLSFPASGI